MRRAISLFILSFCYLFTNGQQRIDSAQYRIHLGYFPQGVVTPAALHFYLDQKESSGMRTNTVAYEDGSLAFFSSVFSSKKDCYEIIDKAKEAGLHNLFVTVAFDNKIMLENEVWMASSLSFISTNVGELKISPAVKWKGKYNAQLKKKENDQKSDFSNSDKLYEEGTDNVKFEVRYANDQITVDEFKWYKAANTGDTVHVSVPVNNYSDKDLIFEVDTKNEESIAANPIFKLPKSSSNNYELSIQASRGEKYYPIKLKSDSISIDLMVRVFGFDLSSDDLNSNQLIRLKSSIFYYRTGNESLLRFYDSKKEEIVRAVSLANERSIIDLKNLKPGEYWIEKVVFEGDKSTFSKVVIQ